MAKANEIQEQMSQLEREFEQKKQQLLEPAKRRLEEINANRAELDREEEEILQMLGQAKSGGGQRRRRRSGGKRMTAQHKKEIVGWFIDNGHIKNGTEMTRELRAALQEKGFGIHDFPKLNDYLPSGWEARSNGLRGTAAKTVFHQR